MQRLGARYITPNGKREQIGSFRHGTMANALPKEKLNIPDMFPYPSGAGLHVGHPLGYIATDTSARYTRMLGQNVVANEAVHSGDTDCRK